jgi:hypothetical protein
LLLYSGHQFWQGIMTFTIDHGKVSVLIQLTYSWRSDSSL